MEYSKNTLLVPRCSPCHCSQPDARSSGRHPKYGRLAMDLGGLSSRLSGLLFTPLEVLGWIQGSVHIHSCRCVSPYYSRAKPYELPVTTGSTSDLTCVSRTAIRTLSCGDVNAPFILAHNSPVTLCSSLSLANPMRSAFGLVPKSLARDNPKLMH